MEYRTLGQTDLHVSRLCLGTMTMGWTSSKEDSFAVMDYAVEHGINFFDTADIYSYWAEGNPGGVAETWIGEWLQSRQARGKVIIATKVRGRMWEGPDGEGLSRRHIIRAAEDSLRRLQVETIDLYQSHWPDENTPLEETFRAFEELIRQGKVRYIGCSNHTAAQLQASLDLCRAENLPCYKTLQPHYNLVHRAEYESELMELCRRENIGVIPYSPLAGGFLTGKYTRKKIPRHSRGYGSDRMRPYMNELGFAILDALRAIARQHKATVAQTAIAWLLANPTVTSAIIGANTVDQLVDTIKAVDVHLTPEEKARLDSLPSPT
ncbi:MAG: aldo/keto reductase [Chloroflexi bacterium]|nr:MAG: aldo/keto reductase [Chloroflexota bacterium]